MSVATSLFFFGTTLALGQETVAAVLDFVKMTEKVFVSRYPVEDSEWEDLQRRRNEFLAPELSRELVATPAAASYYEPGKLLKIDKGAGNPEALYAKLIYRMHELYPQETARDFYLNNLTLTFGWHDVFTTTQFRDPRLFGRPNCSLRLWGYRTPENFEEYRATTLAEPLVEKIRSGFAHAIVAPVTVEMFTD